MATGKSTNHRCPFVIPGIILMMLAAGCSGPKSEQPAPPEPSGSPAVTRPETSMQPGRMFSETTFQAMLLSNEPPVNILKNPAFGDWTGAVPAQWEMSPTSGTLVRKTDRQQDGQPVIEVVGETNEGVSLSQKVADAAALKPGQKYTASAWIRVIGPSDLMLARIGVNPAGEEAQDTGVAPHPGDGSWHKLEVAWQVPAQLMPGLREIRFQVRMMNPGTMEIAGPEVSVR